MRLSRLALAAALAAVWAALPLAVRAQDDDGDRDEQTIEIRKRVHRVDRDGGGDRDDGPRGRRDMDGREPGEVREGREKPRGMREHDPEMR